MFNDTILSIDIGSKKTKIIEANFRRKKVYVQNAFFIDTPENSYNDGEIQDVVKLKNEIQKALDIRKIKSKRVIFTSKSTSIITREIIVPAAEEEDMESLIKFQIERYLPIMSEDYIIQFKEMERLVAEDVEKARTRVAAYPKILAEGYLNLSKELKVTPWALDLNSNGILKLFYNSEYINAQSVKRENAIAFIDMGSEFSEFNVIKGQNLEFTRLIPMGSSYIDVEIAKKLMISQEQGEEKKINLCDLSKKGSTSLEVSAINEVAEGQIKNFIIEVDRMIQYFRNKNVGDNVAHIFIYGGGSKLKGLAEYMTSVLNITVSTVQSISGVDIGERDGQIGDYLNAAGAVIRL